jgi:Fe-S cluster biogenesis protein NfuA/nitrite reductase/ring-hydroxylating ferredoxin subunit
MEAAAAATTSDSPEQLIAQVQDLQARLESTEDSATRELADQLVSAVIQMYGSGLERIVRLLLDAGEGGEQIAATLPADELVGMLLLIHDLHPVPLADRVQGALEQVRPYMESHGGNVELLSLEDGVARIRLQGSCSDCSASSLTLELAIKQALEEAAPDLEGLEVEGVQPVQVGGLPMASASASASALELPIVMSPPPVQPAWFELDEVAAELPAGAILAAEVAGSELLIANVDGTLLAYHDSCASCGAVLHDGLLISGALACPQCERTFFLPRAGRSMDDERIQLEPVPLLREQGRVKVALAL